MYRLLTAMGAFVCAALLVLAAPGTASALDTNTTGAHGHISTPAVGDPDYLRCTYDICLWATDTLTDGECARWQRRADAYPHDWQWYGNSSCDGVEHLVAWDAPDGVYRLCRTGFGNCGPTFSVYFD